MLNVKAENADWLGNLIISWILMIIGGLLYPFGWLFVLVGQPTWWFDTVYGLELLPPGVTFADNTFDS